MKILVVEDDLDLGAIVRFVLQRHGYEVIEAADGECAFERFQYEAPDLVLTDVRLPRMDGWELSERIRRESDTPIVLLTVADSETDFQRARRLCVADYITKPFSPIDLVERIHAVLFVAAQAAAD